MSNQALKGVTATKGTVVKRYPIYKSKDVERDKDHDHKLWWIDIEKLSDGRYLVVTYAQIFSVNYRDKIIEGEQIRRYETDIKATLDRAEHASRVRIDAKKSPKKGYTLFKDREGLEGMNLELAVIQEFLKKYGTSFND